MTGAGILLAVFGIMFIVISFFLGYQRKIIARWPTVSGTVTHASIARKKTAKGGTCWAFDLLYEYTVGNTKYIGNRVSHSDGLETKKSAQALMNRFRKDSEVSVYYNTTNPDSAFLCPGEKRVEHGFMIAGIGTLSAGFILSVLDLLNMA